MRGVPKADEQAQREAGCLEVVEALGHVQVIQGFDRLEFHEYHTVHNRVGEILTDVHAIVHNRHRMLLGHRQAGLA